MPMKDRELAAALESWFRAHEEDAHVWRTPVGRVIRENLARRGNWKAAPRGNPHKGFEAMCHRTRES